MPGIYITSKSGHENHMIGKPLLIKQNRVLVLNHHVRVVILTTQGHLATKCVLDVMKSMLSSDADLTVYPILSTVQST